MIKTKADYKNYRQQDDERNGNFSFMREYFTLNDATYVHWLIRTLRRVEYYKANHSGLRIFPYVWNWFLLRRLVIKTDIFVCPGSVEAGLVLMHPGFRRIPAYVRCGKNCTMLPMVLFGKKRPDVENMYIEVGDNCYIGTGATILGPVKIGNNVTIAAGAVVLSDVPDNAVVGGVPAKVLKIKSTD